MIEKHPSFFFIAIFILFPCLFPGCSDSYRINKQQQIQKMSDTELLSYYQGITDRIKDIDNHFKDNQDLFDPQDQETKNHFPEPHYIGSDSYNLHQIRKLVIQEIEKRNLNLP
jgi:hypothetical protein